MPAITSLFGARSRAACHGGRSVVSEASAYADDRTPATTPGGRAESPASERAVDTVSFPDLNAADLAFGRDSPDPVRVRIRVVDAVLSSESAWGGRETETATAD